MLARANRLRESDEIRRTLRQGKKHRSDFTVCSAFLLTPGSPNRFAFIVPKTVGNAVERNLVKRRLRTIARDYTKKDLGITFVIRANSGSATAPFDKLSTEVTNSLELLIEKLGA